MRSDAGATSPRRNIAAIAGKCATQSVRPAKLKKNVTRSGSGSRSLFHEWVMTAPQSWKAASARMNGLNSAPYQFG